MKRPAAIYLCLACCLSCQLSCGASSRGAADQAAASGDATVRARQSDPDPLLGRALLALDSVDFGTLSPETNALARASIAARIKDSPERFVALLNAVLERRRADEKLLCLVDSRHQLSMDYAPRDLMSLDESGLSVTRKGFSLRKEALDALLAMDRAARADKIILLVGSSYRSYEYQRGVLERAIVSQGKVEALRSVALPGSSQHQLGTTLDFAPIDDSFAATAASRWLETHASDFGFSLSFPRGFEKETGIRWESWHYRYIGREAVLLQAEYFGGIQSRMLEFLAACG